MSKKITLYKAQYQCPFKNTVTKVGCTVLSRKKTKFFINIVYESLNILYALLLQ